MSTVENLKYAVFHEWTDDPPAGCVTLYYDTWFEDTDEIQPLVDEIIEHIKDAIGYEEPDEEDLEDEDFEDEIEGLDPTDEEGNITPDNLRDWSWDNGGSGCGCIVYAEGADIAEAAIEFYEEYLDDIAEVDLEEDGEGNLLIEFPVDVCIGGGDGGEVCVTVPVTKKEFIELLECYRHDTDISDWEGLEKLVPRIEEAAKDEAESDAEELDDNLDCSEANCIISFPEELVDIAEECRKGLTSIEIETTIEKAKENPENEDSVMALLKTISDLVDALNDSIW